MEAELVKFLQGSAPWVVIIAGLVSLAVIPLWIKVVDPFIKERRAYKERVGASLAAMKQTELQIAVEHTKAATEVRRCLESAQLAQEKFTGRDAICDEREKRSLEMLQQAARMLGYADQKSKNA